MPRRRARRQDPVEEQEQEEHVQEEVPEDRDPEPEQEAEPEPEPDPQRGGDGGDGAQQMRSLQFDEELSWRPAKPIPSATLVARLERLSKELADFEQQEVVLDSLKGVAASLAHRNLLQHKDRGVKAYTACCLVEMLRLFAPDAPFTDDQLKMMFTLFVKDILPALHDPANPYNSQHKYVLMSLTDVKSILILPDIHGADDLLLRLFNSTFDGVSASSKAAAEEQVAKDVEIHLTDMLMELIDESPGSVPATVIDAIISQFLRAAPPGGGRSKEQSDKQSTLLQKTEPAAYVMAKNICNGCADKMSRYVSQYFSDVILNASGFATKANGYRQGDDSDDEDANAGPSEADLKSLRQAHLLIRELWRAAPTILQNVVPQLDAELSADNVHLRLIATEAFGDMISGIGAAGPPPPPILDPTAYPPLRLVEEASPEPVEANVLTKPYSPHSFAQTHTGTYRNFVGRKNDKVGTIRAAWVTAAGYILSTSAGGIGLSREEESELVKGLVEKLNDNEEKVRLAAVKAIELFDFRDVIVKLGVTGGVDKEGSIFASLADRCRDRKAAVRVDAMVLLGKLWAVGAGEIADGQEAVTACLSGVPSRIINAFYANDPDLNILLDRVMFECLVPLKYPLIKGKAAKSASQASQGKGGAGPTDQDRMRAERILLMLKALDIPAQKAFFAMQARQPQFAKAAGIFIQQCEAYNGGVVEANEEKVKESLAKTFQWLGAFFPDPLKVRSDLQKFAKLNDRRSYQLVKYAIESESDFKTVRRAINELITKIQAGAASGCLDTLIPLLYRSSCLMFNRSHLATIMDYAKSDRDGLAGVAHQVLNDISQRNPDIFKAHAGELRKEIIEQAPTDKRTNDPAVVDILKAYSSYAKRYPGDINYDRGFTQTLMNYALYGSPPKSAKYAVNILLAKNDDKSKVTATNLLRGVMKGLSYGSPHFLAKLATISQLERFVPTVTADSDDAIHELTIKKILRNVHTDANSTSDPEWVNDADMDEELQAKCLSLKILVNQALANGEEADAEERVKPVFKLLKAFVVNEGEFCKTKDTPLHHKRRLRLWAGLLTLKLCTVKKYDEQFDAASFNKLAELVQDTELQVRRRFMEKLQNYLTRAKLRARFHTILFLVAFEPVTDLKNRVETWIRSRAQHYSDKKLQILEAIMGRLIPLLAHHPDYTADTDDLADFANYFFFYLGAIGTEENISLIYKYAERVKQTLDAINPDASGNLYVLSDLAQAVIRKFQERRNWSFQAWPGKVGLPTGLYTALSSSEVAQQIAKKQYIPDELDERLDDLLRAMDRKKKRKSMSEWDEPPAKRAKTQIKTAIRERPEPKPKAAKAGAKKASKPKAASRPKKQAASSSSVPASERRRSGRAHKVSDYKERDDTADEEEMLDGVAEWEYGNDADSSDADGGPEASDVGSDEGVAADDDEDDEDDEDAPAAEDNEEKETAEPLAEVPDAPEETKKPTTRRLVKLKVPKSATMPTTRRSTRASTVETDEFVELSNSGRHAVTSRDSRSKSPEAYARTRRSSRAMKGLKSAPEPIEPIQEATQESSVSRVHDADEPDELSQDTEPVETKEGDDEDMQDADNAIDAAADQDENEAAPKEEAAGDDDDDDDVPVTRRTRAARASVSALEDGESDVADNANSRRLTRGSRTKKSTQEPSSDFEPGDDSEDADMSGSEKAKKNQQVDDDSPTPRGRSNRRSGRNSRRGGDSADEEPDFDLDELNEEARELRQSSRPRRRPRQESPIVYQEHTRRSRAKVNYYMPPLTAVNIEEDAEDPAPTPSRNRRGRGGVGGGWERNLNTTFGPFGGGGGGGSLLNGPWGTGAAGGADSDSSDDEMVHRSSVAGNMGMTPTSATAGGLLPGGQGLNAEGVGATPNVGKIKDRKALADADPLGVDLNVDFSKVGGLQGHIDQLKEMVQLPLLYPELFTKFHVTPPRGVLFHGPPGTGKTLLARALANSVGSGGRKISFYMRKGADALSKWVGEAEKQLRLLFEEARKTQPSIIFFDEIDGLAPVRSSKQEQIHASIVSTLLALMDGMDGRGQVIVIGATNRPDNIDPALRRPGRFDREFYFPLPDIEGRRSILDIHTKDWGLSDPFKASLAEKTKGYGGADLRALCTEAALNSIQRTYPQIYSSQEKLMVDPDKIAVHASDFMISIKKMIPSSERSATSGAQPLPMSVEPLLRVQFSEAKRALDHLLPRKKKITALEEAMYEQFDDDDHGFGREVMHQEFERSRVFRPRFLIYGVHGMGQSYIASAVLHYFEGVHVQNFDLPSLLADGRPMEQVIVGLFTEVRRHKPSVIYIPNIDAWYATLTGSVALITFQTMLKSISPTDPVLLLATAECEKGELPSDLARDFFGYSRKNRMEIPRPERVNRLEYFSTTLDYVKKKPAEFPDPENRKKRVLEELPVAPTIQPKPPTKAEMKTLQKRDHQLLNGLKIQLQPIMDQINRRYKKFRQPVIPQAQIEYLFAESDPNFVRPDIAEGEVRPFEIVKDKHGNDVLRDTATGKCYYNLETTTVEERLSNGFYARPKDFLFDIKALARDAKNIGDKERTLKANELLSNVEVDVASIESSTAHIDWEGLHQRQTQRAKQAAEKERKRKAMQSITDRIQAEQAGGNDSDSQGPLTLGETVPGSRTMARFQLRSPLSNGHGEQGQEPHPLSNGTSDASKDVDVQMSGVEEDTQPATQVSAMGPPPKSDDQPIKGHTGMTQISQKSAVMYLPPGVSPSAVINEASTTKTSDPSPHRSSNWSTQLTNGNHGEQRSSGNDNDAEIPDTLVIPSQTPSSDEVWPHSQAHALARGNVAPSSNLMGSPTSSQSQARHGLGDSGARSIGAPPQSQDPHSEDSHIRNSGSSASQPLSVEGAVENFLVEVTDGTSGCTIEQLEQINRELMDEIWSRRNEWNRMKVLDHVTRVFNDTIGEIEMMQGMGPLSQGRSLD